MVELGSIQFDKMVVNCDLATEYFKQKNNIFRSSTGFSGEDASSGTDGHNTIHFKNYKEDKIVDYINSKECTIEQCQLIHEKLQKLAKLVDKNAELFGQIEYVIRKIPVNEVKNYDVKLIVQNLKSRSYMTTERLLLNKKALGIVMNAQSPLANLGLIAQLLMKNTKVLIFSTKETAAASYLFTELCQQAGLESVEVLFVTNYREPKSCYNLNDIPTIVNGCIAVITEHSDLDSAVDVLLGTTTKYPWKITRIFVQESIYERFKKVMAWKSSLNKTLSSDKLETLKQLCDAVYASDDKTFLIDYAGGPNSANNGKVLVEAYRTTKELITLVTKYNALYLSLWSSDISEANEIAHKVSSSIVWINGYGIFDGPPNCSQAIYKEVFTGDPFNNVTTLGNNLLKSQVAWSKKTFDERQTTLIEFLKQFANVQDAQELIVALINLENDDFVSIENSRLCVGQSIPNNFVRIEMNTYWHAPYIAKLLTSGVGVEYPSTIEQLSHIDFSGSEIPIFKSNLLFVDGKDVKFSANASRTKVIWTSFGTIFAN